MDRYGKICMLDNDSVVLGMFEEGFRERGYEIFATENAYKFLQYAGEIVPDILILDLNIPEMNGWQILNSVRHIDGLDETPIILLTVNAERDLAASRGVAHYVRKPSPMGDVLELVETYCVGDKKHDVLLVDGYEPFDESLCLALAKQALSCFEVHDVNAAKCYLRKNHPRCVCLQLPFERYKQIEAEIEHDKIFYVENATNLENLASLLQ